MSAARAGSPSREEMTRTFARLYKTFMFRVGCVFYSLAHLEAITAKKAALAGLTPGCALD